tara:strand:- start:169 stop:1497 length:1329 start_codon:yes stop_codon:yes gene_type:complete
MSGALRRFGELGKAGNKQWTLFARLTSGSWLWRFQARLRAISNIVELMTDAQAKANKEMLESIKIRNDLADALKDSELGYRKAETALRKLREGEWTEDYVKGLKEIREDDVIKAMIEEYDSLEEALEKTSNMYQTLNKNATKAQDLSKKGVFKYYSEKFTEGFTKETSIKGIKERMGKIYSKIKPFDIVDTGRKDAMGRQVHDIQANKNSIFTKAAKFFMSGFKMLPKLAAGLLRGLMTFSIYGMLLVIGLLVVVSLAKKIPGVFKKVNDEFKIFSLVFIIIKESLIMILKGVWKLGKAIWEGRFLDAIWIFLSEIMYGLVTLGMGILIGITAALATLAVSIISGIGRLLWNLTLGKLFSSGGVSQGGMALVGEKGPELVSLPAGARVTSNANSRGMGGNTINVHVNGRVGASDAEIRDIANKVAREINIRMNRQGTIAMGG